MKIAIITDSNSGISQKEAKELGITVIPMPFMIDDKEYFEDINLSQKEFYNLLLGDKKVNTSQPSIGYIQDTWDNLLKEYDQIVHIPMSSGLSESYKSAYNLANTSYLDKVFVVDNQRISVTQKRSVFDAIKLVNLGYEGKDIKRILEENKKNSSIYVLVDTLKYLKKGGRITAAAALLGTIFKIKPILQIHGGKLDAFRKTRTIQAAKEIMCDKVLEDINTVLKDLDGKTENVYVDIAYSNNLEEALKFKEMVEKKFSSLGMLIDPLSLSVSCHTGPGTFAIAVTKELIIK